VWTLKERQIVFNKYKNVQEKYLKEIQEYATKK
jgi:hypothetical protein